MSSDAEPAEHIKVVLAEDEVLIRMTVADALRDIGFEVIEAEHADEALAILQADAESVHVLFTDIHMPGSMDGLKLAHHASRSWPWIALLVVSGQARPLPAELPKESVFMSKPYRNDHVIDQIRALSAS